jgi:hypothetical protein
VFNERANRERIRQDDDGSGQVYFEMLFQQFLGGEDHKMSPNIFLSELRFERGAFLNLEGAYLNAMFMVSTLYEKRTGTRER